MKELAVDESLSEEARDSARKALEVLVSSQLLDIEQAAALKKLESEAQFADQQTQVALRKLDSEAQFMEAQAERIRRQAAAERTKAKADAEGERMKAREEAEAEEEAEVEAQMAEWLGRHRLRRHTETITRVAGPCDSIFV